MRKQFIAAGIAATIGLTGIGAGVAQAATTDNTNNPMSSLVDAIATKFNVDKTEVQAVFDEQREANKVERETQVKEDIAALVSDGKITQAQADAINTKRAELQAEREANKADDTDKTRDERKSEMDAKKAALDTWATENNIDSEYLRYVMGHGGPGKGGFGGRGDMNGAAE